MKKRTLRRLRRALKKQPKPEPQSLSVAVHRALLAAKASHP